MIMEVMERNNLEKLRKLGFEYDGEEFPHLKALRWLTVNKGTVAKMTGRWDRELGLPVFRVEFDILENGEIKTVNEGAIGYESERDALNGLIDSILDYIEYGES